VGTPFLECPDQPRPGNDNPVSGFGFGRGKRSFWTSPLIDARPALKPRSMVATSLKGEDMKLTMVLVRA
jgi:hypothetical protein